VNGELGRKIRDHVTTYPKQLNMTAWGEVNDDYCGTSACIAGWALIFSGWSLVEDNTFRRASDGYETDSPVAISDEARRLLDLSDEDYWRERRGCLFSVREDMAVKWLRELVEKAEANHG
jgi:hypothetical protein